MFNHDLKQALILIVDDVRSNQQILTSLLKDDYRLKVASNGARALELARQQPQPDLILLDVMMPEMDGYQVCKQLKADNATRDIPVIFITAADDEASEVSGLQIGAIDYITKPIKPIITRIRIENAINLRQFQQKLNLSAKIIENSRDAVVITDDKTIILDVNQSFTEITGYQRNEVLGQPAQFLNAEHRDPDLNLALWSQLHQQGFWSGEVWHTRKKGEYYPAWLTIFAIKNDQGMISHYIGIASDITLLKQREFQLEKIAHYDLLTGIPNRVLLADRMKQALAQTRREHKILAVCYMDLDGFKPVNDQLGHQAGDKVLIEIAQRLSQSIRAGDTVARLGGDEFVVLLMGLDSEHECQTSIERILAEVRKPINVEAIDFSLSASVGITLFPIANEDADTLLRQADQAMYNAKQLGKNGYQYYKRDNDLKFRHYFETLESIALALTRNEFELYYQPKLALRTGKLVGVEALLRWHHPTEGILLPQAFLPAISGHDLIVHLGDWVLKTAIEQLNNWQKVGFAIAISVNVASRQIQHPLFIEKLALLLQHYPNVSASLLELEIMESIALEICQSAKIINDARNALGISFALDNFGQGDSSLKYLNAFPAKTLKIDKSFVQNIINDTSNQSLVSGMLGMADTFKRQAIAEGVETDEQLNLLMSLGCEVAQGYGIANPMNAEDFMVWLKHAEQSIKNS